MLDRTLYIDRVGAFSYDRLACLRNDYAKNECTLCIEQCALSAFVMLEGKLRLDASACTQCGACIGSCPTNALSLYGFSYPKALNKIVHDKATQLTCKDSLPCLGAFSVEDWTLLLLEGKKSFECDLCSCASCSVNPKERVSYAIRSRCEEANALLSTLGKSVKISFSDKASESKLSRRAFFSRFSAPVINEANAPKTPMASLKKVLKESLNASLVVEKPLSFMHTKKISHACDNCKECVQFCPTKALSYNGDQTKILFQMGKCIGCGICEDICKKEAIESTKSSVDIVDFAYDRAHVLIAHDLQVCLTCKCAFSYKGGEKVCDRCASFEKEHADLFILASQNE